MQTIQPALRLAPFSLILLLMSGLLFTSCSKTMKFGVSPVVPAAEGKVVMKTDKNKNHALTVKVNNLAAPDRLTPAYKEYVVWMKTSDYTTKNLGRLKSKSGTFSKSLTATLKTVTTFEPMGFFITAEQDATALSPGPLVVLRTE